MYFNIHPKENILFRQIAYKNKNCISFVDTDLIISSITSFDILPSAQTNKDLKKKFFHHLYSISQTVFVYVILSSMQMTFIMKPRKAHIY